jgi:uncharacterized protein (TIGR00297 family)
MPFIASIAAVTADKFGSEIGVLDPKDPISLFTFKSIKPGTSGAMSALGTIASIGGSSAIGLSGMLVFGLSPTQALIISLAGVLGCVADTIFGVLEERGIGTKGTTNFICSFVGALIGFFLI